jgi:hypothetical protein
MHAPAFLGWGVALQLTVVESDVYPIILQK